MNTISDYTPAGLARELARLDKKSAKLILSSNGTLSGSVKGCYLFGIDNTTGNLFYRDDEGNWQAVPSSLIPTFDSTIDFSVNVNPNTVGTTFSPDMPNLTTVIYVSMIDGSQWTSNGVTYTLYVAPYWSKIGNSATTPETNYIGTSDQVGLMFKVRGVQAGYIDIINDSTSFGEGTLANNTTGERNTAFGVNSMNTNATGSENTAIGFQSLNTSIGDKNTCLGVNALSGNTGDNNLALGYFAGSNNTSASNQIFINSIDRSDYTGDQTLSPIYIQQGSTLIAQLITLNGAVKINDGTQGIGKVLTSDAAGVGSWTTINTSSTILYTSTWSTQALSSGSINYIINASDSTAKTLNLFATPTLGDQVIIKDKKGDAGTNNITINGNGKLIEGLATLIISSNKLSYTLLYDGVSWNII